jgi:hypothetical protein
MEAGINCSKRMLTEACHDYIRKRVSLGSYHGIREDITSHFFPDNPFLPFDRRKGRNADASQERESQIHDCLSTDDSGELAKRIQKVDTPGLL